MDFKLKIIFAIVILFPFVVMAQRSNGLAVEGKITVEQGVVEGAVIQMFQDGRRLDDYGVGSDGKYKVELNYGHKFELIFSAKKNFQQKIVIDTNVPKKILESNPRFPPFPVNIFLYTDIPGIERTFSENTVMKLYYSENVDNFISQIYYNDAQIKKLIDQAIAQSQLIGRESDYLSKLTRAELAELKREYEKFLESAGKEYSNEKFLEALDGYKAASRIFPKEQFPKDRINEINDLLGLIMAAGEMDKALAARFELLVKEANLFFDKKQYEDARNSYNRAISIKPNDTFCQVRINEINEILKKQQKDSEYKEILARADELFREKQYSDARDKYSEALKIKPNEIYPKEKIAEIDMLLAKQLKDNEILASYKKTMADAEALLTAKQYEKAINMFQKALSFIPNDITASTRIDEIKKIIQNLETKSVYDKQIAIADNSFKRKQYPEAIAEFKKALEILPSENYPQEQILKINEILNEQVRLAKEKLDAEQARLAADQAAKDKQYSDAIAKADGLFNQKEYSNSRTEYQNALKVKPAETYPQQRITEINTLISQMTSAQKAYDEAIVRADKEYKREAFDVAKSAYNEAIAAKPNEKYPVEMIAKIDLTIQAREKLAKEKQDAEQARLVAEQAAKDKQYSDAVAKADGLFNQKEYLNSRTEYQNALKVKPAETYPQQRITEINTLISQMTSAQRAYDEAIVRADKEYKREAFDVAKAAYNEAIAAKPNEKYPVEMIAKIDLTIQAREKLAKDKQDAEQARLAAEQAAKDKQYSDAVAKADGLFNQKDYSNSRTEYQNALKVKPAETYPQQRITEINTLISQMTSAQKAYDEAIVRADKEYKREAFDVAKAAYNEAIAAKPNEKYPVEMIAKIDLTIQAREKLAKEKQDAEQARLAAEQAAKDKQYSDAIAKADGLFNQKEYSNSRTEYQNALKVKPAETYPQQRITEINTLISQMTSAQKAYDEAIARADKEYKREAFEVAKTAYNEAIAAKPNEKYPVEMIAKIDLTIQAREKLAKEKQDAEQARLAAEQAAKDKQYSDAIAKADGLFNQKEYSNSRTEYQNALKVKPAETYPQQRITEINTLISQMTSAQKAYDEAIQNGDKQFTAKNYTEARTNYTKALELKPGESYPGERLRKIEELIQQNNLEEDYRKIILAADDHYKNEAYNEAKTGYQRALEFKPNEQYPKIQILKIDNILKAKQDKILADQKKAEDFEKRKTELDRINAESKMETVDLELNTFYQDFIRKADDLFAQKKFIISRAWYFKAWDIKPNEKYPPQKIAEINKILASMQTSQLEKDYQKNINMADSMFRKNEMAASRGWYSMALSLKPGEPYPAEQISEIRKRIDESISGKSEELFKGYIKNGEIAEQKGNLTIARYWYKKAAELRPANLEVKNKIIEVEKNIGL